MTPEQRKLQHHLAPGDAYDDLLADAISITAGSQALREAAECEDLEALAQALQAVEPEITRALDQCRRKLKRLEETERN